MSRTQRSKEGYLLISTGHGEAPSAEAQVAAGISPDRIVTVGTHEYPTITCSHCNAIVVINAKRTRERAWCSNCDHYICDNCGERSKTQACVPMAKILDEALTAANRGLPIVGLTERGI